MVSGTAAGQALVILSSPILTRLYSPGDFGVLAVYTAVLAFVVLISSLRYELAIPLPRTDRSAANLLTLSLCVLGLIVALTSLAVALFGESLTKWLNTPALEPYLWALPLGILLGGANKALSYWALRKMAFGCVARTRFQQGAGMAASQVALGYFHWGALGLIVGHIVGYAAGLISLLRFASGPDGARLRRTRASRVWYGARRFRNFPIYSAWSDMANVGGTQMPLILFASLFSPTVAGLYMLAHRVASAPAALMAEATGKAFMAHAVPARRDGYLAELTYRVFVLLLRAGLGPLIIVAAIAPELFSIVFGAQWAEAGRYLQWIIPWIAAVFVFAPLTTLYAVLERQKVDLYFQITLLVTRVCALVLGALLGGPIMATACYASSAVVVYVCFGTWLLHAAGVSYSALVRTLSAEMSFVAVIAITLVLIKQWLAVQTPLLTDPSTLCVLASALLLGGSTMWRARTALMKIADVGERVPGIDPRK